LTTTDIKVKPKLSK